MEQRALVDIFCENLAAVGGEFSIVNRLDEAASKLTAILDEIRPRRIAISDSPKVRALVEAVQNEAEICERASSAELFDCDIGITEAQWAIAETGTLVLESKKEYSRLTSLVPETHICLLPAANIRSTMSDILQVLEIGIDPVVTFITGPSRTSDIELTLAIGVHGPQQLIVIVIGDEV